MAKVLMNKGKKIVVEGREKTIAKPRTYYIRKTDQDVHIEEGTIKKEDFNNNEVTTNKGDVFSCFDATAVDDMTHVKRGAQVITPKDAGIILAETGLTKDSIVVEAGSGSGALTCFLARLIKHVYSYDINEEHFAIAKQNIKNLHIENVTFKLQDVSKKIDQENVDAVILDMPEPWTCIETAKKAVKIGGFIVAYVPSTVQIQEFCNQIHEDDGLMWIKTQEIIARKWKVKQKAVRPVSDGLGHTAFLTFVRRLK